MRSRLICALYSTVILIFSLLLLFSPWEDFSPYENRTLRKMPVPTLESIADKSFSSAFSSFCADQFPFRARLLSLDSELDLTLGRLESKKIMMGREHNLIKRCEYESLDSLNANLAQIERLKGKIYDGVATRTDITRITQRLGDDIGKVYGWKFPQKEKKLSHER